MRILLNIELYRWIQNTKIYLINFQNNKGAAYLNNSKFADEHSRRKSVDELVRSAKNIVNMRFIFTRPCLLFWK